MSEGENNLPVVISDEEKLLDLRLAEKKAELANIELRIEQERTERNESNNRTALGLGLGALAVALTIAATQARPRKKKWWEL